MTLPLPDQIPDGATDSDFPAIEHALATAIVAPHDDHVSDVVMAAQIAESHVRAVLEGRAPDGIGDSGRLTKLGALARLVRKEAEAALETPNADRTEDLRRLQAVFSRNAEELLAEPVDREVLSALAEERRQRVAVVLEEVCALRAEAIRSGDCLLAEELTPLAWEANRVFAPEARQQLIQASEAARQEHAEREAEFGRRKRRYALARLEVEAAAASG